MKRKETLVAIENLLDRAAELHLLLVREEAMKVMLAHPNLRLFCMGMGSANFDDFAGKSYNNAEDAPKYMKPFFDTLDKFDYTLKTSGAPLRITRPNRNAPLTIKKDW